MTPKQEAFCLKYLETGNASEAYRQAYNTSSMSEKTVNEEACKLLKHPKIAPRLADVRQKNAERLEVTVDKLTEMAMEAYTLAMADEGAKSPSAAISAVLALGKLHGLLIDKGSFHHTHKHEDELKELE